jgi:hypothetical protein
MSNSRVKVKLSNSPAEHQAMRQSISDIHSTIEFSKLRRRTVPDPVQFHLARHDSKANQRDLLVWLTFQTM